MAGNDRPEGVETLVHDHAVRAYRWRSTVIDRWVRKAGVETIRLVHGAREVAVREARVPVAFIVMIDSREIAVPDGAMRDEIERHARLVANKIAGLTMYVAGTGFGASVVRSLLTGLSFVVPRAQKATFSASIDDAAKNAAAQIGERPADLARVLSFAWDDAAP